MLDLHHHHLRTLKSTCTWAWPVRARVSHLGCPDAQRSVKKGLLPRTAPPAGSLTQPGTIYPARDVTGPVSQDCCGIRRLQGGESVAQAAGADIYHPRQPASLCLGRALTFWDFLKRLNCSIRSRCVPRVVARTRWAAPAAVCMHRGDFLTIRRWC